MEKIREVLSEMLYNHGLIKNKRDALLFADKLLLQIRAILEECVPKKKQTNCGNKYINEANAIYNQALTDIKARIEEIFK